MTQPSPTALDRLLLLLAEGLGSGRSPWAPGTAGTVVGLLWFLVLLLPASAPLFAAGALLSAALAVLACTRAETLLQRHDPGSVVLDEIVAVPVCFVTLLLAVTQRLGHFPGAIEFLQQTPAWTLPVGFGLFRLFDIWKPWPVRQSQRLPRGWGVVADDLLAALWVNLVCLLFIA